ncbi:MAG: elongation factor P [Bacteroidetes bacterium]|nr:elongation factor P [Bacteroidota bacterium]
MAKASDLSNGAIIRFNGELYQIVEFIHRTPGNLRAFYQAKMKNLINGRSAEYRFGTDESVELVRVEVRELQYLYKDGNSLVCMDAETFEQIYIPEEMFGDTAKFMKEEMKVLASFEGDKVISATGPNHVELMITYTEPGVKGDTATNTLKPAKLETGAEVMVPLFCDEGQKIKIDTRTGQYVERVK